MVSWALLSIRGWCWWSPLVERGSRQVAAQGAAIVAATKKENLQLAGKIGALAPAAVLEAAAASPQ